MNSVSSRIPLKFLLVDDHPMMRRGLCEMLKSEFPACEIAQAANLAQAREQLENRWNLVILDQNLPDGHGIEFLKGLEFKPTVLVLSMYDDETLARLARDAGAMGYASKAKDPGLLLEAIHAVLKGRRSFPPMLEQGAPPRLSPKEKEVLDQLLKGRTPTEIAKEFGVRQTTVQSYKSRLYAKLKVNSMAELVRLSLQRGLG
jgi:DNA-binding NarL/FixJ family response regulator